MKYLKGTSKVSKDWQDQKEANRRKYTRRFEWAKRNKRG